jgi:UDP-2-acetamido-3-amino-2,3-dideoxy-glucuronate N-acetyltransferase
MPVNSGKSTAVTPRVAVVGCGVWGKNLVRNFKVLGALAAVHDTDAGAARLVAEDVGVPALSLDGLLASREIDGVVIATPAESHGKVVNRALEAGKHVFVEKPLSLDIAEAGRLCALAHGRGLVLMVGHLMQYHPAFLKLDELVRARTLGGLRYIYSTRLNLGRIRREENILWSFAPHDISMILSLAGGMPRTVQATGACYLHDVIADVTTTHLGFANGINAHVFVSWLHPFKEQKLVCVGERGMAVLDDCLPWSEKLKVYDHRIEWRDGHPHPNKAEAKAIPLEEAEPLSLECQHFLSCVAGAATPRTDGAEGSRVLRVLDAAEQAMRTGQTVLLSEEGS